MADSGGAPRYTVLATKYRPAGFDDLRGQDVLVRTLRNAVTLNRIANAFILTGIRGVGKTTTARIIARALNCTGGENPAAPSVNPCGVCDNCVSIRASRHPDILEMDAASRTGVDDIREIIDMAAYAPSSARYKVFIIDEVHMLSKSAFNALLKTLEEPPSHVKFIFATTEIRKVPVTVLSRCQRFDLKRLTREELQSHLAYVCTQEGREIGEDALRLLATAAEGSARDALSLLDQTLAMHEGTPDTESVRRMLGFGGAEHIAALFTALCKGDTDTALHTARGIINEGAEPQQLLKELQDICHNAALAAAGGAALEGDNSAEVTDIARQSGIGFLTRMWNMLVKGSEEMAFTYNANACAEMTIIRVCHAAALPTPEALVKQLRERAAAAPDAGLKKKA